MENQSKIENVIIVHLESLNEDILWKECETGVLKNIKYLKDTGTYYANYYSTATSTIMAMSDFMFGDRMACETSASLQNFCLQDKKNLFTILEELGFQNFVYMYPEFRGADLINANKIFKGSKKFSCANRYEEFLQGIGETISQNDRFCMYVYDWTSLNVNEYIKNPDLTLEKLCVMRYRHIDETVGFLLDALQKSNKLSNTLLVLFGDHGDELYAGGFHYGFTHAIEPLYSVIKSPLIIHYGDTEGCVADELTDLTDIKDMIARIVCTGEKHVERPSRKYSFARNLFINQKSKRLNKSYSVTDGSYLLVSSVRGMELYFTRYPCYRYINLLNFFTLSKHSGLKYKNYLRDFIIQHYDAMIARNVKEFQKVFLELSRVLKMELSRMEKDSKAGNLKRYVPDKIRYDIGLQAEIVSDSVVEKLFILNDMLKKEK